MTIKPSQNNTIAEKHMPNDLTNSPIDRQNVLNNKVVLTQINEHLNLGGLEFEGDSFFTKQNLMDLFEVSDSTIERHVKKFSDELKHNGYQVLRGKKLSIFKELLSGTVTDEGTKTTVMGVFNFRATLNMAMVLAESERAKEVRSRILDIVIDVFAEKGGGNTKHINQRDVNYLASAYQEHNYRKEFTSALSQYLEMGNYKYGVYTNKIYQLVFKENAKEYKQILRLSDSDKVRETLYAEVLTAIASVENGLADLMKSMSKELGRKLTPKELDEIVDSLNDNPFLKPVIEDARTKMASRDMSFRDALHTKLEAYIQAVPEGDFDKFLRETSKSLEEQLSDPETLEVLKRLKDR
jgi:hypothetical protein